MPTTYTTTEPDPTDTGSYGDVSDLPDGPFKDWPGAGPTPPEEEEGFRDKIIKLIEKRRRREREEYEQRCEDAAGFYGGTGEPNPTEPEPTEPYDPDNPNPTEPEPDPEPTDPTYQPSTPNPSTPNPTSPTYPGSSAS